MPKRDPVAGLERQPFRLDRAARRQRESREARVVGGKVVLELDARVAGERVEQGLRDDSPRASPSRPDAASRSPACRRRPTTAAAARPSRRDRREAPARTRTPPARRPPRRGARPACARRRFVGSARDARSRRTIPRRRSCAARTRAPHSAPASGRVEGKVQVHADDASVGPRARRLRRASGRAPRAIAAPSGAPGPWQAAPPAPRPPAGRAPRRRGGARGGVVGVDERPSGRSRDRCARPGETAPPTQAARAAARAPPPRRSRVEEPDRRRPWAATRRRGSGGGATPCGRPQPGARRRSTAESGAAPHAATAGSPAAGRSNRTRKPPVGPVLRGDRAAMLLDDLLGDREPEPRPAALGREVRVEEARKDLRSDAGPVVLDRDRDPLADAPRRRSRIVAAAGERLDGVADQVARTRARAGARRRGPSSPAARRRSSRTPGAPA